MSRRRTALVTGAGGGMAVGINERLANLGHTILCVDADGGAARLAAARVTDRGGDAHALAADLTDPERVGEMAFEVSERWGGVDVLVGAMGMLDRRSLAEHSDESFLRSIDVNLIAPARIIRAFAPGMVTRGWGRIVNISSIAALTGYPYPAYAAAKAGLSNLTRSLVIEYRGSGVTVNAICPGVVDTPMVIDSVRERVAARVPTGVTIDPDEIGALVAFLASDDARSINGAELVIDGGATSFFAL